jgi:CHAT domain-containing protein
LCTESAIEKAAQTSIDERTVSLMPEHARMNALAGLVFAPLVPQLDEVTTLTVVPDGVLHRLSFAALPMESPTGSTNFLDERFALQQLVRSRDLLSGTRSLNRFVSPSSSRILLIGNPAFTGRNDGVSSYTVRGWQDLPGTEKEVDDLAALCREFGVTAVTMQRGEASEKALKHLSGDAPRVLHLATHGYFYPVRPPREGGGGTSEYRYARGRTAPAFRGDPDAGDPGEGEPDALRGRGTIAAEGHPLLRSGLILAGANAAWSGRPVDESGNDGILTAMEVSQLDLEKTELVVLSACETALGDIRTGEGVFGLQRAFLAAGVSSLVMSLWKVSDQATAEFMVHFYRSWLSGASKRDALREARRQLREQYTDPQIWAAFVLVGQ